MSCDRRPWKLLDLLVLNLTLFGHTSLELDSCGLTLVELDSLGLTRVELNSFWAYSCCIWRFWTYSCWTWLIFGLTRGERKACPRWEAVFPQRIINTGRRANCGVPRCLGWTLFRDTRLPLDTVQSPRLSVVIVKATWLGTFLPTFHGDVLYVLSFSLVPGNAQRPVILACERVCNCPVLVAPRLCVSR